MPSNTELTQWPSAPFALDRVGEPCLAQLLAPQLVVVPGLSIRGIEAGLHTNHCSEAPSASPGDGCAVFADGLTEARVKTGTGQGAEERGDVPVELQLRKDH